MPVTYDCRTCGACCTGEYDTGYGFATVSTSDRERMSPRVRLQLVNNSAGGETSHATPYTMSEEFGATCTFLRGTPGVRCSCRIYETRPTPCRDWKVGSRGCRSARAALGMDAA